jgi:hypothetical protein
VLTPKFLLHLEGIVVAAAATIAYHHAGCSWLWFAVLFLAPDASALGYAAGPRTGAATYNLAHTYAVVALIWVAGHGLHWAGTTPACLIWLAHIGADRAPGFGLKYPSAFQDTHLAEV